jgi:integrase
MKGSTFRRCACKGDDGRQLGTQCPRLGSKGHGTWYFVTELPAGPKGVRRQERRGGFPTQKAAQVAMDAVKTRVCSGSYADAGKLTVGEYLQRWIVGKGKLRPSTRASYSQHIANHLEPAIGHIRLSELRSFHIAEMLANIRAGDGENKAPGAATTQRIFATLRNALATAVQQGLIIVNPCTTVEIESESEQHATSTVWTPQEAATFLDYVDADRLGILYDLTLTTGMRRGEVIGLRWQDVDLERGVLSVRQSVVQVGGTEHVGQPKTRKSTRRVPLDKATVALLKAHRKRQVAEQLQWGEAWLDTDGRVFTREDGRGLSPEWLSRQFKLLSKRACVPIIRFHDLRHSSASLALAGGVPLRVVSERLGHSSIGITADLYTHVFEEVGREAAEQIAAVIPRRRSAVS